MRVKVVLFALVFGCLWSTTFAVSDSYRSMREEMSSVIAVEMEKRKITGLSVAVVNANEVIWSQGFGYGDVERNQKATADTIYPIGSITKLFTAMTALKLQEEGLIHIDHPVNRYLPEFHLASEEQIEEITFRLLLTHRSGLPSELYRNWEHRDCFFNVLDDLADQELTCAPGTIISYSNVAFSVLGLALARAGGDSYQNLVRKSLLDPLDMGHTYFDPREVQEDMAQNYKNGKVQPVTRNRDLPAGGMLSSVTDMSRFARMMLREGEGNREKVVSDTSVQAVWQRQNPANGLDYNNTVGLGWFLAGKPGVGAGRLAFHDGRIDEYNSLIILAPDEKLGVVLLSNSSEAGAWLPELAFQLLQKTMQASGWKWNEDLQNVSMPGKIKVAPAHLETLTGVYAGGPGVIAEISLETQIFGRKRLTLKAESLGGKYILIPLEGNAFLLKSCNLITALMRKMVGVSLAEACFILENRNGYDLLVQKYPTGYHVLLGVRVKTGPIPETWKRRLGQYRLENLAEKPSFMAEEIHMGETQGLVTMTMKGAETQTVFPLVIHGDNKAVTAGLGRYMGDVVRTWEENGKIYLKYSGLTYVRE